MVAKLRLILPIGFVVASGCAFCDCQKMEPATPTMAVADVGNEPIPPAITVEVARSTGVAPPVIRPRALTNDNVRRLQRGLREIGFDSGPVDGIPGARTKAAYGRLQSGCAKLGPLLENLNLDSAEGRLTASTTAGDKLPNRSETQEIQGQLRAAGFDPGPVDGIFGSRTQVALRKFKGGCLMAKEFEAMLNDALPTVAADTTSTRPPETSISSSKSETRVGMTRGAGGQEAAGVQLGQAREEVRILQLRLRDAGFDPGPFDGVMGPKTRSALAQYEASQGGKKIKTSSGNQSVNEHY